MVQTRERRSIALRRPGKSKEPLGIDCDFATNSELKIKSDKRERIN